MVISGKKSKAEKVQLNRSKDLKPMTSSKDEGYVRYKIVFLRLSIKIMSFRKQKEFFVQYFVTFESIFEGPKVILGHFCYFQLFRKRLNSPVNLLKRILVNPFGQLFDRIFGTSRFVRPLRMGICCAQKYKKNQKNYTRFLMWCLGYKNDQN